MSLISSRRTTWRECLVVIGVLVLGVSSFGCSSAPSRDGMLDGLFAGDEARGIKEQAPDLFAMAERAKADHEAASTQGDVEAAADYASEARLFYSAAAHEAERVQLASRRDAALQSTSDAIRAADRDETRRAALARESRLDRARAVALRRERVALDEAVGDERRRYGPRSRVHARAARQTATHARLILAAARSMGASEEAVAQIAGPLDALTDIEDEGARMGAADSLVRRAYVLLGDVRRAREDGPSVDELRSLVEQARRDGFPVRTDDLGTHITFARLFRGPGAEPSTGTLRSVQDIAAAHPRGPLQVRVYRPTGRQRRRVGEARVVALREAISREGTEVVDGGDLATGLDGRVELLFPAYSADLLRPSVEAELLRADADPATADDAAGTDPPSEETASTQGGSDVQTPAEPPSESDTESASTPAAAEAAE